MATPSATFTELVSTTWRQHSKEVIDNVSKNNALYARLMKKGNMRTEDGGLTIAQPLDYNNNGTYQRYSGYDILNIQQSDVITAAEYQWRQIALNVVASGLELRSNSGDSAIVKLAKARIKNAMRTFKNNFSYDLYADGTLPNQIGGLQSIVADSGVGVVGGIATPLAVSTGSKAAERFIQRKLSRYSPATGGRSSPVQRTKKPSAGTPFAGDTRFQSKLILGSIRVTTGAPSIFAPEKNSAFKPASGLSELGRR